MEYRGVRINRDHMTGGALELAEMWDRAYIDAGMRPSSLTVRRDGVDVSERPEVWPATVRDYRGPGRLEWIGLAGR